MSRPLPFRFVLLTLVLPLLATSCASTRMAVPDDIADGERLVVSGRQGWRPGRNLRFGDYAVRDLRRSPTRGTGASIGPISAGRDRQSFHFRLEGEEQTLWLIECQGQDSGMGIRLGSSELGAQTGRGLDCGATGPGAAEGWRMRLETRGARPLEGGLLAGEVRYEVTGVDRAAGSALCCAETTGYTLSRDGRTLAAVDINGATVWLRRDLTGAERRIVAGAAASLLLLQDGRD